MKRRAIASAKRRTTMNTKKRPTMSTKKKTLVNAKKKNISKCEEESNNKQRGTTSSVKENGNKHEEKLEKKVGLKLELEPLFILTLRFFLGLMMAPMFFFPFNSLHPKP